MQHVKFPQIKYNRINNKLYKNLKKKNILKNTVNQICIQMSVLTNTHTHTYKNMANLQSKFSVNKAEKKKN